MTDDPRGQEGWDRIKHALRWAPLIEEEHARKLQHLVDVAPTITDEAADLAPSEIQDRLHTAIGRAAEVATTRGLAEHLVTALLALPDRGERLIDCRLIIAATEQEEHLKVLDSVLEAAVVVGVLEQTEGRFAILMATSSYGGTAVALLEAWFDDHAAGD